MMRRFLYQLFLHLRLRNMMVCYFVQEGGVSSGPKLCRVHINRRCAKECRMKRSIKYKGVTYYPTVTNRARFTTWPPGGPDSVAIECAIFMEGNPQEVEALHG